MPRRRRHGLTLIELVVTVAVLGTVSSFLAMSIFEGSRAYIDLRNRSANVGDAHHALDLLCREVQEIRSATDGDIPAFSATSLSFTNEAGSSLDYAYSGSSGTLTRNGFTLLDRLTAFSFTYLKADGTAAAASTEIWSIQIDCTLNRGGKFLVLRTRIFPRNFTPKLSTWRKA